MKTIEQIFWTVMLIPFLVYWAIADAWVARRYRAKPNSAQRVAFIADEPFVGLRIYTNRNSVLARRRALMREIRRCGLTFPLTITMPIGCPPRTFRRAETVPLVDVRCGDAYVIRYEQTASE